MWGKPAERRRYDEGTVTWCTLVLVVGVAMMGLTVAACASGDGSGTGTSEASTTATAPATVAETGAETGAPSANDTSVTDYLAYTGGTDGPADSSLSQVVIGWVNQQGGPIEVGKTTTDGARLAVKYVNEHLGGVDGHPVSLRECFIAQAEEEGQKCAQELVNDEAVAVIGFGAVGLGNQSFFSTLSGAKPVLIDVSVNPVDQVQDNAGILFGDVTYIIGPWGTYARDVLGAKSAALVYPETAGTTYQAQVMEKALTDAGVEVKKVAYSPEATDLTAPLIAADVQSADMVVPVLNPGDCVNMAKALEQVGHEGPVVATPICLTPATVEGLGDFPIWTYGIAASLTTDTNDPAVPPYQAVLKEYGQEAFIGDPWYETAFSEILTVVKFLNAAGADNITPEAVLEQLEEFRGPLALGAPEIDCGKYAESPASCNDQSQFYTYEGGGKFIQASSWLRPPSAAG